MELLQEFEISKLREEAKAVAHNPMGNLYLHYGKYEEALIHHSNALEINKKSDNEEKAAKDLISIGNIYFSKCKYDEALSCYLKCQEIFKKLGSQEGLAGTFHQIGYTYQKKGRYDDALKQYKQSLKIREKIGDIKEVSTSLHNIGLIYHEKGNYEAALKHYQKSLEIEKKIGDIPGLAISLYQVGKLHFQKKEFATALEFSIQAFLIFTKIGSPYANQARKDIARASEKLSEDKFHAILKEFKLSPETFGTQKELMNFLVATTFDAVTAPRKNTEEKEKIVSQINEILDKLSKAPEDPLNLKSYFQMLLAFVNGEEVQTYMEKIPKELKEMFEKIQEEKKGSESVNQ
jgi:tetratricopeptide (TPR) repeat protein